MLQNLSTLFNLPLDTRTCMCTSTAAVQDQRGSSPQGTPQTPGAKPVPGVLPDTPRTPATATSPRTSSKRSSMPASPYTPGPATPTHPTVATTPIDLTPLPKVDLPPPRSKKEVVAEASRKNIMAWIERKAASPRNGAAGSSNASTVPSVPFISSPRQPSNPSWLLATGAMNMSTHVVVMSVYTLDSL